MPRRVRLVLPHIPLHIVQRGNNRNACFFGYTDYLVFLDKMFESAWRAECKIHAYILMPNHVHLLVSPHYVHSAASLMKNLGQNYTQYVNRKYGRVGTLWQGRFRSCLVGDATYFLTCQRYIELNALRAKMVTAPAHYPWSSYRANAEGEPNRLVTAHDAYLALGNTPESRLAAYRELCEQDVPAQAIDEVRSATNSNLAFGSTDFLSRMENTLGLRLVPGRSSRPADPLLAAS